MFGRGALVVMLVGLCGPAEAGEKFVCLGEKGIGFKWNGRSWEAVNFNVSEDRFLVEEKEKEEEIFGTIYTYEVRRFGVDEVVFNCSQFTIRDLRSTRLSCGGMASGMLIDLESLRYQEVYSHGYIDGKDSPGDTPSMTIGTCSRLR